MIAVVAFTVIPFRKSVQPLRIQYTVMISINERELIVYSKIGKLLLTAHYIRGPDSQIWYNRPIKYLCSKYDT